MKDIRFLADKDRGGLRGRQVRSRGRQFPLIGEYAFLSDCHTGALVARDGSVEWLCLPRFDSPSVFATMLDRNAGSFRLAPRGVRVPVARRYEPGTNVLESAWMTRTGWLVVRDALIITNWSAQASSKQGHHRPVATHEADRLLLRTVECVYGDVEVDLECEPVFDYGREQARWSPIGDGGCGAEARDGGVRLRLTGDLPLEIDAGVVRGRRRLEEGERCFCALAWGDHDIPDVGRAFGDMQKTLEYWRSWIASGRLLDHPWRIHLQRSALVLKGLTYAPTGAIVAAPTTSLPETSGGERNWDYRYAWIRDASFALWAMHILGFDREADDFVDFVADLGLKEGPGLQVMYGIGGERDLPERELGHLSGYDHTHPVRVGNAAFSQRQNDHYGALLDAIYIHSKAGDHVDDRVWQLVQGQVAAAIEAWPHPDQGIWESRGEPKHFVSSKLMCWVALDRGSRLARKRGDTEAADHWRAIAAEIKRDIMAHGVSKRGVFRAHYDTDELDASTLLVPLVRFLRPRDARVVATVHAIRDELTSHGLVLRYRTEHTDDGVGGEEGTFLICSFWLVSALSEIGEPEQARALCERLLSFSGDLDLYAEELDAHTGRQLGNFPQAFTHLALINAVSHVIADETVEREPEAPTAVFSELRDRS
jgi:GH15 family glucan-1,4-alpha-glucosidase